MVYLVLGLWNAVCGLAVSPQTRRNTLRYVSYHTDEVFWNRSRRSSIVAFAYRGIPYTSREKAIVIL